MHWYLINFDARKINQISIHKMEIQQDEAIAVQGNSTDLITFIHIPVSKLDTGGISAHADYRTGMNYSKSLRSWLNEDRMNMNEPRENFRCSSTEYVEFLGNVLKFFERWQKSVQCEMSLGENT